MNYVLEVLPSLLDGAKMTLQIFCWTLIGSLPLGLIVGLALISRFRLLKAILRFYVWLMRGTPLLLQLIFVFYGLPLVGLTLGRFDAALFAFILNYTAYFAEIFRGGLQSIDKGQYESAKVLRLTYWQTIRKIIGIGDLLRAGNVATSRDVTLVPLVMVGVVYLVMTAVLTFILRKLEQYYSYWK